MITQKIKIGNGFFIRFSTLRVIHENLTISEGGGLGTAYHYLGQGHEIYPNGENCRIFFDKLILCEYHISPKLLELKI